MSMRLDKIRVQLIREINELEESTDNKLEQTKNGVRDKIIYKIQDVKKVQNDKTKTKRMFTQVK